MNRAKFTNAALAFGLAALLAAPQGIAQGQGELTVEEARKIGIDAVVYGLPLVLMDITGQAATNVKAPQPNADAPVNQFGSMSEYPPASDHSVVRMNLDTLYTFSWLDLEKEPMVLSVPNTDGRYYMMPMLDAWTNIFASPGKRTTGTEAGHFVITGPGWQGSLPDGVEQLKSPTNKVWITGRTQTNGPKDYPAVHAIQAEYKLTPLSAFGKPYTPPPGVVNPALTKTAPIKQVEEMDYATFFNRLAQLLEANPPPAADDAMLQRLAVIDIVPGQTFDPATLDPAVAKGLEKIVPTALGQLQEAAKKMGKPVNGWYIPPNTIGEFGTDYGLRAVVALIGLGANLAADAIYPNAFTDADGQPLNGANRYTLRFPKGQLPPANAFWSLTMYNAASFMVENPINRYNISGWMPLEYNEDGSLDIYIQNTSPGKDKEANWLPAAKGEFSVTMRVYWPKEEMIKGSWKPPGIRRVK